MLPGYICSLTVWTTLFVFLAQRRPDVCHRPRQRQEQPPPDPRRRGNLRQDQPYGQTEGTSGDVQPQRDSFIKAHLISRPSLRSSRPPHTSTVQQRASTRPPDFVAWLCLPSRYSTSYFPRQWGTASCSGKRSQTDADWMDRHGGQRGVTAGQGWPASWEKKIKPPSLWCCLRDMDTFKETKKKMNIYSVMLLKWSVCKVFPLFPRLSLPLCVELLLQTINHTSERHKCNSRCFARAFSLHIVYF